MEEKESDFYIDYISKIYAVDIAEKQIIIKNKKEIQNLLQGYRIDDIKKAINTYYKYNSKINRPNIYQVLIELEDVDRMNLEYNNNVDWQEISNNYFKKYLEQTQQLQDKNKQNFIDGFMKIFINLQVLIKYKVVTGIGIDSKYSRIKVNVDKKEIFFLDYIRTKEFTNKVNASADIDLSVPDYIIKNI